MIEVLFSPQCSEVMQVLKMSPDQVVATINERHCGLVSDGLDRIIAARWFTAESIIFANEDIVGIADDEVEAEVRTSPLLNADSKITLKRSESGFTFVNFNFEAE